MKSKKMHKPKTGISEQKISKIAGIMFLLAFIVPTLNWTLILSKFSVKNGVGVVHNLMTNEILFRVGISIELFMAVALIVLAWALYIILKTVNRNFALLALLLKLAEAVIVAVIVLLSFIALQVVKDENYLTVFTPEQLQAPLEFILGAHTSIFSISMVFLGLDMIIFCYLFFKSKYIPRKLAGFGILSFALIFIHALMYMIKPQFAEIEITQIIFWAPSGIFEVITGSWLLLRGLNTQSQDANPI